MEDNWDLYAVVRGCATISSTSSTTTSSVSSSVFSTTSCSYQQHSTSSSSSSSSSGLLSMMVLPSITEQKSNQIFSFFSNKNSPFEARNTIDEELHELCKPFYLISQPNNNNFHHSFQTSSCSSSSSTLSSSSFSYSSSPNSVQAQQKQSSKHPHDAGSATTPRSKRRKNQLKKVCQVKAENLSSDIWAWRKYGQKPIKGSPYPRGYYRCSSSKGCLARKQVEKNKTDPTMFIVTYTGEHNHPAPTHRNSLAGSTRQKTPQISTDEDTGNNSLMMTKHTSPSTSSCVEEEEEEEELALAQKSESELEDTMEDFLMMNDEFGSPDMEITDDFFEGLDELKGSSPSSSSAAANGECFGFDAIPSLLAK